MNAMIKDGILLMSGSEICKVERIVVAKLDMQILHLKWKTDEK